MLSSKRRQSNAGMWGRGLAVPVAMPGEWGVRLVLQLGSADCPCQPGWSVLDWEVIQAFV